MNKKLELAQDKIIGTVSNMCSKLGLNHFMAQLYVVLYMSKESLSLDDLVQRLKVSKGNVSVNIRELERWGAVRKVWVKGSRKDFYEAKVDIKHILSERIKSSMERRMHEITGVLDEFNATLSRGDGDFTESERQDIRFYKERLKRIEDIKNLISTALALFSKVI